MSQSMVYSWENTYYESNYQKTNRKIQIVWHSTGKCQCHNRQNKNWKNTLDYGRLNSHDNHMQCSILGWILDWEKITTYGVLGTVAAAAAAKLLQSCPTLCDPIDGSPPGSPAPGILQAITLEWVAISFSNALKWKVKVKSLSHVQLFTTPWTAAYQAPSSIGFSRQEYWSGMPSCQYITNLVLIHTF